MGKKKRSRSSAGKTQGKTNGPVTATPSKKELMSQMKPPEPFNFQEPSSWTSWIKRYKIFHSAFGLLAETEEQQINMLLFCMGQEADELLTSLGMTEDKRKSFDSVVNKFEEHFITNNNLFRHRLLFFERDQNPGEKTDSYLDSLNELSEKCEWSCRNCKSIFKDEMVLLKLITGISNKMFSKRLKDQGIMTLTMGAETIRLLEIIEEGKFNDSNKQTSAKINRETTKKPGNQQGDPVQRSSMCNSSAPLLKYNRVCESPVRFHRNSTCQDEKGSMRSSFSSGVGTGDEYELPANSYCTQVGQKVTKAKHEVQSVQKPSVSCSYEDKKSPTIPFLKEKNNIDFPSLPEPCVKEGIWEFPSSRKTARPFYHGTAKPGSPDYDFDLDYDTSDDDEFSAEEEKQFVQYLREFHPDIYLDYISTNAFSLMETPPKMEAIPNEPKYVGNYHFSVSGHQSRKSLRNQCQQKLKDLKKYRY